MSGTMSDQKSSPVEPATLNVQSEEEVKLNAGTPKDEAATEEHTVQDRDPNAMNEDVKIRFEDVIGEPDSEVYSFDKVWVISIKLFTCTKLWCYRITSVVCALPCSLLWGCWFACLAFWRIWCCVPCLRSCDIELACIRRVVELTLQTCCAPCWEAFGMIFRNIRIRLEKPSSY